MYYYVKIIFDTLISLILFICLLPVFLIISFSIKMSSKGPVFFKQKRRGRNGEIFTLYKFRTMVVNAENIGTGIKTFDGDPRITCVGKFLRKTSLDELPQLINILKGEMALIGPRPVLVNHPYSIDEYSEHQKKRFSVRPGITGYAQVKVRNQASWDERIELDIEYIENLNLINDIKIFLMTFIHVLKFDVYS